MGGIVEVISLEVEINLYNIEGNWLDHLQWSNLKS